MSTSSAILLLLSMLLPSAVITHVYRDAAGEKTVTVTVEVVSDDDQSTAQNKSAKASPAARPPATILLRTQGLTQKHGPLSVAVMEETSEDEKEKFLGVIQLTTPDGKVVEYDLSDKNTFGGVWTMDLQNLTKGELPHVLQLQMNKLFGQNRTDVEYDIPPAELEELLKLNEAGERLMVGVHCAAAEELLRRHLKSGEAGLVVMEIIPDSPALAAGIEKGDVMLQAGEQTLSHPIDLLKAVKAAGETEMAVELIRNGDRMTIGVTPRLLKQAEPTVVTVMGDVDTPDANDGRTASGTEHDSSLADQLEGAAKGAFRLRQISPGIVIDKSAGSAEIEKLVQQAMKAARSATENQSQSEQALRKQIAELKEQLKMLSERLSNIESQNDKQPVEDSN